MFVLNMLVNILGALKKLDAKHTSELAFGFLFCILLEVRIKNALDRSGCGGGGGHRRMRYG